MSFVQELKRRNVIKVGVLYLVLAWVLLQVTDVLSSLLRLPESAGPLVFLLLVVGFVPVLIFAWVFEMTPEGLKREADIDRSQSVTHETGQKINTLIIVLLLLAIAGLVADRLIPEAAVSGEAVPVETVETEADGDETSIAVLPFADLSPDQDQQHFTDGLSEELLNLLVRVDDLQVASRTSSFAYRGSTLGVPEISKALNVGHILEGSVRKDGDRIRITAQLIEAETDRHLWSDNFDRQLVDIFAIQDEIANAIVAALTGKLGVGDKAVTVVAATENVDAYAIYLEARELFIQRVEMAESLRLFRKAIELDPGFARAWEGLAAAEVVADDWLPGDGIDHTTLGKAAAEKALSLDPELSMPLAVLGHIASEVENDWITALDYMDAAIEKDPRNTTAWLWRGIRYYAAGYHDEAIADYEKCLVLDPGYENCRQHLALAYLSKGEVERALELHNASLDRLFLSVSEYFVPTLVRSGHRYLALFIADAKLNSTGAPVIEWIRAIENPDADNSAGYARLKDWERQTDSGLSLKLWPPILITFKDYEVVAADVSNAVFFTWYPDAADLRRTPYFKTVIRDSGIFALWQARGFPPQCRPIGADDFACSE